jgi:Arc/MetJ-type ribon-helix-helix transcriptional regulator
MEQLSIALPEDDIGWAQSRVSAGEFASVDAYFSELAQRDRAEAHEFDLLQDEIDKGLVSGVDPRGAAQIFREVRAKYLGENG